MAELKFTHATTLLQGPQICSEFCSLSLSELRSCCCLADLKEQALDRKDLSSLGRGRVREGRGKERDKFLQSNHAPLFSSDPLERVRVRGRASYEIKPASLRISQGRLHCMCSVSSLKYSHLQCLCLSYKLLSAIKKKLSARHYVCFNLLQNEITFHILILPFT